MDKTNQAQPESDASGCLAGGPADQPEEAGRLAGGPPWLEEYKRLLQEKEHDHYETSLTQYDGYHSGFSDGCEFALELLADFIARLGEGQDDRSRAAG